MTTARQTDAPLLKNGSLLCGPLLRYTYIDHDQAVWNGTVLVIIDKPEDTPPSINISNSESASKPVCLLSEHGHTFWRFHLETRLEEKEQEIHYTISGAGLENEIKHSYWVPGKDESMRIMFYSCNGYDTDANPKDFAGPVLWDDVMRIHEQRPFHVQIGGGDQVYSDDVRMEGGPLKEWGDNLKPKKRAAIPCTPQLEKEVDEFYFKNYCKWYSTKEIALAMASIAQLNIWDDHDIIDGFGSYEDKWQKAPVFMAIGRVAWKYYSLFQQQTPENGEEKEDRSWMIGKQQGPYIKHESRSICTTLGKRLVFFGLDCRTERTMRRVCTSQTYDDMFNRLEEEVGKAADTTHLLLLLGIPIAYPRLVWAESLLNRRTITPLRLLNRKFGVFGGIFNKFDGSAELLDDLNDHWCAGIHKKERNHFVQRLQAFAAEKQVRVTILGGDVHLAAVGRFFTKAKLNVPQNKDPKYMLNVISSAITNASPPMTVANVLNQRNKLHRLDATTHENMMDIFNTEVDGTTNRMNRTMMPRRNYVIITEHAGMSHEPGESGPDELVAEGELGGKDAKKQAEAQESEKPHEDLPPAKEMTGGAGTASAAAPVSGTRRKHALDVAFRVEIDQHDPSGSTRAYGFMIPALEL